ncbi:PREDICTED: PDF receptor-like [Priapulus caudatus]|uniref:PDF receptor-like n=1 Tax=Priapulus caudatus TaxID=37621 RepID=A0ABM1EX64_PRICU|nr:PREDICTED: PDF receptor-like [Priapulus caudatus]
MLLGLQQPPISQAPLAIAILCESFYVLLEYAKTAMFMWFLLEGVTLHNMVAIAVFSSKPNYVIYYLAGWGVPAVITNIWAVVQGLLNPNQVCWFGYNILKIYWIMDGPRTAVIILNIGFLLNIIRVLVTKMRATHSSEAEQARSLKSHRTRIHRNLFFAMLVQVMVRLIVYTDQYATRSQADGFASTKRSGIDNTKSCQGIINGMEAMSGPLDKDIILFAVWSFGVHFLVAFQGFFISLAYCFLNEEGHTITHYQGDLIISAKPRTPNNKSSPDADADLLVASTTLAEARL